MCRALVMLLEVRANDLLPHMQPIIEVSWRVWPDNSAVLVGVVVNVAWQVTDVIELDYM